MCLQCLFRTFTDPVGFIVTVQKDEDVFKNERKILFDGGEGFEKDLEAMIGEEIGQNRDEEIVRSKDRI